MEEKTMGFLASLIGGPIVGIFGSLISGFMSIYERKQKLDERREEMSHELKLQEMNINARGKELESEALIAHTQAVAESLAASYQHDASYGPIGQIAATVLRFVRPALTFLLLGLVGSIYFTMPEGKIAQPDGVVTTLGEMVIFKIMFLSEVAVTWWFLDRRRTNK